MKYVIAIGAGLAAWGLVALILWDGRQWDAYATLHACMATGASHTNVSTVILIGDKGATTVIPVITVEYEYSCDDGRVWR